MDNIKEQLTAKTNDLHVNTLNINLDNAIDTFLLFYTGYDAFEKKDIGNGYCDIIANDAVNIVINEYVSNLEHKGAIQILILSTFELYKQEIRNIIEEKLSPIRETIARGEDVNEDMLKETSESIVKAASNYYHKCIEDLCNEITITNGETNEGIRDYFYQNIFKKLIGILEDKIYCTMGITKNSFDESNAKYGELMDVNNTILANINKM